MKAFDLNQDIRGTRIVLRAALNVPIENGASVNTFRITEALKTLELLSAKGARTVVLAHIGREKTASLRIVFEELKKHTHIPIRFVDDVAHQQAVSAVEALHDGEVLLLENTRREQGEIENSEELARVFASYGDVFVNDAFADSHRPHASIVGIPKYIPGFAGPNFTKEYDGILPARTPESPAVAVIGGAKFLTKEPLIRRILDTYDHMFIGGALAHDFLVAKGIEVGRSLVSHTVPDRDMLRNGKLILPEDVVTVGPNGVETKAVTDVSPTDTIYDIGPQSLATLAPYLTKARFILWNGPLGNFEHGYTHATESLAQKIANSTARSVVGGGDTIASIEKLTISDKFSFVSTAGGAMLDFIAHGTLVGIEALG